MAYALKVPCVEGLIRNRYSGRTFIEGGRDRKRKAETKYTPLREVLEGKRVLLVEDSIVRATTLHVLLQRLRQLGQPREDSRSRGLPAHHLALLLRHRHVDYRRVVCAKFLQGVPLTPEIEARMAAQLGADSLRYLPVDAIARAIGLPDKDLCRACITGEYPTPCGQRLARIAQENDCNHVAGRTYDTVKSG